MALSMREADARGDFNRDSQDQMQRSENIDAVFPYFSTAEAAPLERTTVNGVEVNFWSYKQLETLSPGCLFQRVQSLHQLLKAAGFEAAAQPRSRQTDDQTRWILATQAHLLFHAGPTGGGLLFHAGPTSGSSSVCALLKSWGAPKHLLVEETQRPTERIRSFPNTPSGGRPLPTGGRPLPTGEMDPHPYVDRRTRATCLLDHLARGDGDHQETHCGAQNRPDGAHRGGLGGPLPGRDHYHEGTYGDRGAKEHRQYGHAKANSMTNGLPTAIGHGKSRGEYGSDAHCGRTGRDASVEKGLEGRPGRKSSPQRDHFRGATLDERKSKNLWQDGEFLLYSDAAGREPNEHIVHKKHIRCRTHDVIGHNPQTQPVKVAGMGPSKRIQPASYRDHAVCIGIYKDCERNEAVVGKNHGRRFIDDTFGAPQKTSGGRTEEYKSHWRKDPKSILQHTLV